MVPKDSKWLRERAIQVKTRAVAVVPRHFKFTATVQSMLPAYVPINRYGKYSCTMWEHMQTGPGATKAGARLSR